MRMINRYGSASLAAFLLAGVASAAMAQDAAPAPQDPREARIEQLEAAVQQLSAEVEDLKRGQAAQIQTIEDAAQKIPPPPSVNTTFVNGRPTLASADGKFSATLHGVMQLDTGAVDQRGPGPLATDLRRDGPAIGSSAANTDALHARNLKDGTLFRRARLGVDGTAFGDFDYRVLLDFGGSGVENAGQLYETWLQYSGFRPLRVRIGAFAPAIGLDDQASTNGMPFIERAGSSDAARNLAAGDTRLAAQLFGYGDHWFASAAVTGRTVGVINTGTASATPATYGDQLGFVGRVAATPLHGKDWLVHLGVHGSYVDRPANTSGPSVAATGSTPVTSATVAFNDTPEQRIDGTKLVDTGKIDARHAGTVGFEVAVQKQNVLLQGEYEYLAVDRSDPGLSSPDFSGFYVSGSWVITGETRKYNTATAAFDAPPVAHPFNPKAGTWGAFELAARYSDLDLNYHQGVRGTAGPADAVRGGDQSIWTAGVNWYLSPIVRFVVDYQHVKISRLSPNATNFNTPVGAQIGQSYDAVVVRSQVAF